MRILYTLVMLLLPLASLFRASSRATLKDRFGRAFRHFKRPKGRVIWVHAVSLGETRAVTPLVKRLQSQGIQIVFTTITKTGLEEAKRALPKALLHAHLPFDLPWLIGPIVKRVAPDLLVITETDHWLHFQEAAGCPIVVVNGKLSKRSFSRFLKVPHFAKLLYGPISHFCLQNSEYEKRFLALGLSPQKLTVTGNLKFDLKASPLEDLEKWEEKLGIYPGQPVLTLGSTHAPEEEIFLPIIKKLLLAFPDLKILLVPRHPERFDEVATLLSEQEIAFTRYRQQEANAPVMLVDAMGVLSSCYALSTAAFVGGSLTKHVGGHNLVEALVYGIPTLHGPYMHGQPDMAHLGIEVTEKNLLATLLDVLVDPSHSAASLPKGALDQTERVLQEILSPDRL